MESSNLKLGDFKSDSKTAVMSVDLRVVDASTGSIKISETVEVEASVSSGMVIDGRSMGGDEADPINTVQRVAANKIAGKISLNIFPIKIATSLIEIFLFEPILYIGQLILALYKTDKIQMIISSAYI